MEDIKNDTLENQEEIIKENDEVEQEDAKKDEDPLEKLQKQLNDANDKYVRLYAEFDNYRRRTKQEYMTLMNTASEKVLSSLLPIIDDFSRALESSLSHNNDTFINGIKIINDKLLHLLKSHNVVKIETKEGDEFNEEIHEAIVKQKTDDDAKKGKIVGIVEAGYKLHDKILRYAKVIIGE